MSTAAFSEIAVSWYPRETEASLLAQLLRLSRLTVLYGEAGAGKTALLKNGVLPRLRRRASDRDFTVAPESPKALRFPDRRQIHTAAERAPEVAIFFDEWNEAPLAALEARMRGALPARRPPTAESAASMAKSLEAWNRESGVRFLFIFDAFDEYLAASRDAPGIRKFDAQFVEVLEDDRLPANFLLALRDERQLLERFEGRIARLGDTAVRLPSWHRSARSPRENERRPGPPAAAAPDLNHVTAALVLKAAPKCELQTDRATSEAGEPPPPVLEAIAFELVQSPPPVVTAEPESNSRTAPRVSEVADSRSQVPRHRRVKLAWLALPLIGISLLLVVRTPPKPPSEVANVPPPPKPPSKVVSAPTPPKPPTEVKSVPAPPKPPSHATRAPATTERSTAAEAAGGVSEIARLMARANALLAQRDIASARVVLERAVDMGSAKAAFALAQTYDPTVLDAWRTFGTLGDAARARQLYAKARAGGVQEAQDRLNALRE